MKLKMGIPFFFRNASLGSLVYVLMAPASQLSAQGQTADSVTYHWVSQGDTVDGWYNDPPDMPEENFTQYAVTYYASGNRPINLLPEKLDPDGSEIPISIWHQLISGSFEHGIKTREWIFFTSNYQKYSTCYGGLNWKTLDYDHDTILVREYDRFIMMYPDSVLSGEIQSGGNKSKFRCVKANCKLWRIGRQDTLHFPREELEFTLERVSVGEWLPRP